MSRSAFNFHRQLQEKARPRAVTGALHRQFAAKFNFAASAPLCEAKPVPVLARAETMRKNARQILRHNADAIVNHPNLHAVRRRPLDPVSSLALSGPAAFVARMFGVGDQIDENLQNLVTIHHDVRHVFKLADQSDIMSLKSRDVDFKRVFHERGHGHQLGHARKLGVGLLHGDDDLDMINVVHQRLQLARQRRLFSPSSCFMRLALEITRQLFAAFILCQEPRQVAIALLQQFHHFAELRRF